MEFDKIGAMIAFQMYLNKENMFNQTRVTDLRVTRSGKFIVSTQPFVEKTISSQKTIKQKNDVETVN